MAYILLVDDDKALLGIYKKILSLKGFDVLTCENAAKALEYLGRCSVSVVISDIIMPRMNGMELLAEIKKKTPETEVIMLTAEGSISGAVEAVKKGAFSYLVKPADVDELISNIRKAEEFFKVKSENQTLKEQIATLGEERKFIGISHAAQALRERAAVVGKTDSAVLITGETGTGKEVLANMIHKCSNRADRPFVCVNCGALNENLIESELFGSEKGAYTGADRQRRGRFEIADGGTIFFDEIGELSMNMQTRLLRVLQEKSFERVGGYETLKSDFRLITATNRDLKKEVADGKFRSDLYYRINIIPMEIPPLRQRKEDIPELAQNFLNGYARELNKPDLTFDEQTLHLFLAYDWPGNVRELRNIVERMAVLSHEGILDPETLPEEIRNAGEERETSEDALRVKTKAFEKEYILKVIQKYQGNVAKAAEEMQIAKKNLYKKLNEYDIKYGKGDAAFPIR